MQFPTQFKRRVGAKGDEVPKLGSDKRPEHGEKLGKRDNHLSSKTTNINGFPSQRVAVALARYPEGAPALPCALYLQEDSTGAWLKVPGAKELVPGELAYFDAPAIMDRGRTARFVGDDTPNSGALDVVLVVGAKPVHPNTIVVGEPETTPEGEYVFVMGCDVSNPGT